MSKNKIKLEVVEGNIGDTSEIEKIKLESFKELVKEGNSSALTEVNPLLLLSSADHNIHVKVGKNTIIVPPRGMVKVSDSTELGVLPVGIVSRPV